MENGHSTETVFEELPLPPVDHLAATGRGLSDADEGRVISGEGFAAEMNNIDVSEDAAYRVNAALQKELSDSCQSVAESFARGSLLPHSDEAASLH